MTTERHYFDYTLRLDDDVVVTDVLITLRRLNYSLRYDRHLTGNVLLETLDARDGCYETLTRLIMESLERHPHVRGNLIVSEFRDMCRTWDLNYSYAADDDDDDAAAPPCKAAPAWYCLNFPHCDPIRPRFDGPPRYVPLHSFVRYDFPEGDPDWYWNQPIDCSCDRCGCWVFGIKDQGNRYRFSKDGSIVYSL